ncbi:MAG: lysylphosphatidylglycerol synthase transmembrane domain-containing protein [Candidatus Brocadiaceae bacterium]|jgi:uncharacterized protein (TIRG00374 family)
MANRRAIWAALKVAIVLVVIGLLYLVLRRIGFRNIFSAIRSADPATIGSAALLFLTVFVLWCFRWVQIMNATGRRSFLRVFPIYMAGVFVNIITPGARVGGEPVRAYYMSKAFGGEKTFYLGTILADKVSYGAVFFGFVVVSVFFVVAFVPIALVYKLVLGSVVLGVLLAVVSGFLVRRQIGDRSRLLGKLLRAIYEGRLLEFIRRRFPTYEHFEEYAISKMDNLVSPLARTAGSPRALTRTALISAVSWLLVCLAHQVLFHGLGAEISFSRVLVIVTISTFVGDVSMSPGGAGFMEAAMLALCAAFGVKSQTAAAVTLVSRGMFYLFGLGLGGGCLAVLTALYGRD